MPRRPPIPPDLPVFAELPVRHVRLGSGLDVGVHVSGKLGRGKLPIVCVPGQVRNMTDYTDFAIAMRNLLGEDWPVVLIDLPGHGRSGWRRDKSEYNTSEDARVLHVVLCALAIDKAVFVGLGAGGQVIMALGALRAAAIAGAVLIDSSPLTDPRGLVRQRTNLEHVAASRGEAQASAALRQILATDYPSLGSAALDRLAMRLHAIQGRRKPLPLYDPALVERFKEFSADDVFEPQWQLFNTLAAAHLLIGRTQLTDRLRKETFEEMVRRRPDAVTLTIKNQGSPALLNGADETGTIADFIGFVQKRKG